jgi:hypothetical protein
MRLKHNGVDLPGHFNSFDAVLRQAGLHRYTLTAQEIGLIRAIVERLHAMLAAHDPVKAAGAFDVLTMQMDIATIHCNDRRLNLSKLLLSDATDFRMDLLAMHLYTDRKIGKLSPHVRLQCEENKL